MTNDRSLENLSLKELGARAASLGVAHWSRLRKAELQDAVREILERQEEEAKASKKSRRGRPAKNKLDVAQPTLFDVQDEPEQSAPSPAEKKRKPRRSKRAEESETPLLTPARASSEPEEAPKSDKKTRRSSKKASLDPVIVEQPAKRKRAVKEEEQEEVKAPPKKRGRKPPVRTEAEVEAASEEKPKKKTADPEAADPVRKKRQYRRRKGVVEEDIVEEKAEQKVEEKTEEKTGKRGRKKAASEPVESAVEPSAPVKSKRGRKSAKHAELVREEEIENKIEEEVEVPVEIVETPKKRRSRKSSKKSDVEEPASEEAVVDSKPQKASKVKKESERVVKKKSTKKFTEEDLVLWDWDDEEDEYKPEKNDDEDDDLDIPEVEPELEPEPEPEPVSAPVVSAASEEAIALKQKLLREKIIGSSHDQVDRLVLLVCDSYWLRACWEITPALVERVRSAMGRYWHTADPVLRVFTVDVETKSAATRRERYSDLEIRGGVDNWYVPVDNPPSAFMVELGYRSRDGQFFTLISSNIVKTPQRFVHDAFGRSTVGDLGARFTGDVPEPYVEMGMNYRPRRPFSKTETSDPFPKASSFDRNANFDDPLWTASSIKFSVDAEVVIKGQASPGSTVSIKEDQIKLRSDGSFSIRYSLPERRHVFPVVAASADGAETQTIVLAIDRNTKILDPVFKEDEEE